jgi:hypothetical protein
MVALYFDRDASPIFTPTTGTQALNMQNLPTTGNFFKGMAALPVH